MTTKQEMNQPPAFKLLVLGDAKKFLDNLPEKARKKVEYNIRKIQMGEKDYELFKKLENSPIWEFRTTYDKKTYRLFAFWDTKEEAFVIVTHGIIKKTQKTPQKEIIKAQEIMKVYNELKYKK